MDIVFYLKVILEIALLWYFIYMAFYFIRGTRTEQLLKGVIIVTFIFIVSHQLGLEAMNWVISRLFPLSLIALVIIFQPELRRGLAQLGQFGRFQGDVEVIEEISRSVFDMSKKMIGSIIVIERETGLKTYIESGVIIDSKVSQALIGSIFMPKGPLHDGAVIIHAGRLVAAGCVLPLSQQLGISKSLGTRHRAGLGISEETDAIAIIVSEETGAVSIAAGGTLTRDLDEEAFTKVLRGMFYKNIAKKTMKWPRRRAS